MALEGERIEERRPLLQDSPVRAGSGVDQPTASRRGLIVSSLLILLSCNLYSIIVDTAGNQLVEGAACKQLHPEVTDWYGDRVCKSLDVQDRLALITGWEFSWALVPGLLLAIPYGVFMDRYGPRAMLILVALGGLITQTLYLAVSEF